MNIKAFKKTCCLGLMLMLTTNAFAGSTWYRDCEVKLSSPSSAKGVVYVEPYFRLRAGDFRNRVEAEKCLRRIKPRFKEAFVTADMIYRPKINAE